MILSVLLTRSSALLSLSLSFSLRDAAIELEESFFEGSVSQLAEAATAADTQAAAAAGAAASGSLAGRGEWWG